KPSQNQYTELILRTLGTMQPGPTEDSARTTDDETAGLEGVKNFLRRAGIGENDVALNDGSGLSRNDLISANTTVQLLTFMSRHKYFAQFRDALPIAGVDGTLRTRMRGTPAEGNVRGRRASGLLNDAQQLSRRGGRAPRFNGCDRNSVGVVCGEDAVKSAGIHACGSLASCQPSSTLRGETRCQLKASSKAGEKFAT